ncbi:retrovirus-related pol polyprotein from transposon TNT 1-94 [Tanacetum coccineum]
MSVLKKKAPAKAERSKGIDLLSEAALLEEAQLKKAIKISKRETNIRQAGVPNVSKVDSSKSEYESWGDSDDDNDNDDQQSDDERTKSDDDDKAIDLNKTNDEEEDEHDDNVNVELKDSEPTNEEKGDEDMNHAEQVNAEHEEVSQEVKGDQVKDNALATICLGVDLEPDEWIKDSGCSKHMAGNRKLFSTYKAYNGCNVIFGSNLRGNIIGKGQICDNKCSVTFSEHDSEITKDGKVIASKKLVRNLPKLKFDQHFCDACKIGKQAHASHKAKNMVSTTRCLELLHMDLFGPSAVRSYGGNRYTLVIVDDYSRKIKESLNVTFDETHLPSKTLPLVDDDLDEEEAIRATEKKNLEKVVEDETLEIDEIVNIKESRNHPLENVIGNLNQRTLRSQAQNESNFFCFISTIEPKNVNEALTDESWIVAMQEELNQYIANDV